MRQAYYAAVHLAIALTVCAPPEGPQFVDVPVLTSRLNETSWLADIVNRCNERGAGFGYDRDRSVRGHETVHQVNAMLRNARGGPAHAQCFYVLEQLGYKPGD